MNHTVNIDQKIHELSNLIQIQTMEAAEATINKGQREAEIQHLLAAINPRGGGKALKFAFSLAEWLTTAFFAGGFIAVLVFFLALIASIIYPPTLKPLPLEPKFIAASILFIGIVFVTNAGSRIFYSFSRFRIKNGIGRKCDVVCVMEFEKGINKHSFVLLPLFALACAILAALAYVSFFS